MSKILVLQYQFYVGWVLNETKLYKLAKTSFGCLGVKIFVPFCETKKIAKEVAYCCCHLLRTRISKKFTICTLEADRNSALFRFRRRKLADSLFQRGFGFGRSQRVSFRFAFGFGRNLY